MLKFNNKLFIYVAGMGVYILLLTIFSSFEINKRSNQDGINSKSIVSLGNPLYYELETREAYRTSKVYLQNSKNEYKSFYLDNDGVSHNYKKVREFVFIVDNIRSNFATIHLGFAVFIFSILYACMNIKTIEKYSNFCYYNVGFIIGVMFIYIINGINLFEESIQLINNADLIFESIVVPIS